jgi:uncharacterized protein YcgI (DUF1989 family)
MSATNTTHGARDHARAQAGTTAAAMPVLPAPDGLTWAETVASGGYTSMVLARGTTLRLRDVEGDACAHVLLYNADQPWERLNVADTVKIPWQAYLGAGHPLLSDQGRVLATVQRDTSCHHDALCGTSSRPLFVLAAAKHGLEPRDVPPSVSFFKGVRVKADGTLEFLGSAGTGGEVELRMELPAIALIVNAPHPLGKRGQTPFSQPAGSLLEVHAWRGSPTRPGDELWSATPELERAFLNTEGYAAARGIA